MCRTGSRADRRRQRSGKSTTTLELVAGGLQFLTDEVVELDPASGRVTRPGRAIGLEGPARSWHPQLRPPWLDTDEADRWTVPPTVVGELVEHGDLDLCVHLEFTSADPPQVERLEPLQALGHLCTLTFNRGRLTEPVLGELAALVDRVPSAVVRHSGARDAARAILDQWTPGRADETSTQAVRQIAAHGHADITGPLAVAPDDFGELLRPDPRRAARRPAPADVARR